MDVSVDTQMGTSVNVSELLLEISPPVPLIVKVKLGDLLYLFNISSL